MAQTIWPHPLTLTDMRRSPRVFWALNHATLAKTECALLEKLGCEVLTPKVCPKEIIERSGAVDYSYDRTLTIPAADLAVLNTCDFYASEIDPAAMELLNRHFDAIFVSAHLTMVENFHKGYQGLLVFRAFGREKKLTYADLLDWSRKKPRWERWRDRLLLRQGAWRRPNLLEQLVGRGKRFVFAGCYEEVIANEPALLRSTSAFLPLGLPAETWAQADTWTSGDDRVMFVCPCVHHPYYGDIYRSFKAEMGDLPFAVYGNQAPDHGDARLVGVLPRADYDGRMRRHAARFYPSSEPCHLHYHPLEAVAMGVPLVFMAGGMLARMGGADQPGLCRSAEEAQAKLRSILGGDQDLIGRIRTAQVRILDEFRDEFVEQAWRQGFLPLLDKALR